MPWGELPVVDSNRGGNVREGIVHGGKCPGVKCPRNDIIHVNVLFKTYSKNNFRKF